MQRRCPDVVNIHYSNHDVKGPSDSFGVRMGLISPNLEIERYLSACSSPRGLKG